jgi:hypothetical protein
MIAAAPRSTSRSRSFFGSARAAAIDPGEHRVRRPAEVPLHYVEQDVERHHRQHPQQVLQLEGDRLRQEVLAQAQDLPELDIGRAEQLEAAPQLHRERLVGEVAPQQRPHRPGERPLQPKADAGPRAVRPLRPDSRD